MLPLIFILTLISHDIKPFFIDKNKLFRRPVSIVNFLNSERTNRYRAVQGSKKFFNHHELIGDQWNPSIIVKVLEVFGDRHGVVVNVFVDGLTLA